MVARVMKRKIFAGISAVAAMVFAVASVAQEPEEEAGETTVPGVIVTGTRLAREPVDQPYAFYRTTQGELKERVGRTILDRLNYGPGVFIQRTAPNQASPYIRGLTGEQTLLMIDGVRLSHALMRPGPNQYAALVPGMSVDALDAILGSSSVVNGSDGLTGALDYRLAPAGRGVSTPVSPWIASRVDSGNGGTIRAGLDGVVRDWAYSLEFGGSAFHDRVGGDDFRDHVFNSRREAYEEIPNTAYDGIEAGLRLAYSGMPDHFLELDAGHTRQIDAPRPGGYAENSGDPSRLFRYFDPQDFSFVHLRDTWETGAGLVSRLQTTLWWHQFGEEQFRASIRDFGSVSQRVRRREYDDKLNAFGTDVQATTMLGAEKQHELTWGGTVIHEFTDNSYREFRSPAGVVDPALVQPYQRENWPNKTSVSDDSSYDTLGLFVQDNWNLTRQLSLLAGARYSRHEWSFGDVDGDASDITGSMRGMFDITPNHKLFAGFSRGFRAPNLKNLDGAVDRGSSGVPAHGNPDLDPEISYTWEGGWKWQDGRNNAAVTVFNTEIDDLIQRNFSGGGEFTNVEGADIHGFESAWDYGLYFGSGKGGKRRLAVIGSVSLVDATRDIPVESGGIFEDNISRANRLYGRIGLKYEQNRNWWGLARVRWHDDYDDVATHPSDADADDIRLTIAGDPDGSMPGYSVLDLVCGWRSSDGNREISFFIENVGDDTYREPGSGVDGVGRSVGVSASVRM